MIVPTDSWPLAPALLLERRLLERAVPYIIFGIACGAAFAIRAVAMRFLRTRTQNTHTLAAVLLRAIRIPSILWCIAFAIAVSVNASELTHTQSYWALRLIGGFLIISISLVISNVAARMIYVYGERNNMPFAVAGLSRTLTHIVVLGVGALLLLRHFDISVTPLLTALGVGGLAVALALQDTLANFFAGVHILVENPINLGDFVKLSSGEEGVITDIGWRTTRLRTFGNNVIVIPNTKITSGILTNYNLPDARVTGDVLIMAALDADIEQVANIAMDVATNTEGVLRDYSPIVLFDPGITLTHLQFKLVVHCANMLERGLVLSRLRVGLLEAFRRENIPLPAPERVAVYRQ